MSGINLEKLVKKKVKSKKKKKKKYLSMKCEHIKKNGKQCRRDAVGKGTLCRKHGGILMKSKLFDDQVMNINDSHKYNPDYHPFAYLMMARDGKSNTEIAADFLVSEATLENWSKKYGTFSMVYEVGKAMHESYYLKMAKQNMQNPMFQTALFKFIAANKLGFADKIESRNLNVHAHGVLKVPGPAASEEEFEKELIAHNNEEDSDSDFMDAEFTEK